MCHAATPSATVTTTPQANPVQNSISASFQQLQDVAALQRYHRRDNRRESHGTQYPRLPAFERPDPPVLLLQFCVDFDENTQDGIRPLVHTDQQLVVLSAVQVFFPFAGYSNDNT